MSTNPSSDIYFAALPAEDVVSELQKRWDTYQTYLRTEGQKDVWSTVRSFYFGGSPDGSNTVGPTFHGREGEITKVRVNHLRALGQNLLSLTGTDSPSFQPIPANTDLSSQAQARLASGVLDYYLKQHRLDKVLKKADELAIIYGSSYVAYGWDALQGEDVRPDDNGNVLKTGEPWFQVLAPYDCAMDPDLPVQSWYISRHLKNRYELAIQYPELADKILTITNSEAHASFLRQPVSEDLVFVYRFVHAKTIACSEGRIIEYLDEDTLLLDSTMPFEKLPVVEHKPTEVDGEVFGYSPLNDLAGLQYVLDQLYSIVTSNQLTFGVQNLLLPDGCNISPELIPGGMNVIKYNPQTGKPEILQMLATPPEIFSFIQQVQGQMESLSGINSVARGAPDTSRGQMSGAAMALLDSKARQFASGLISSARSLQEEVGTALINLLKAFAHAPRIAQIAGRNKTWMLQSFSGADLQDIQRVAVQNADPYSKSIAGRLQIAETLIQNGVIKDGRSYLQVLQTGNLDTAIEEEDTEALLIRSENEMLQEGNLPITTPVDDDARHIQSHRSVLSNPQFRQVPELVQVVSQHIQAHLENLKTKDQDLMAVLQQQPLPSSASPPSPGGPVGGAPPEGPAMPKLPKLPGASTPYDPSTGMSSPE